MYAGACEEPLVARPVAMSVADQGALLRAQRALYSMEESAEKAVGLTQRRRGCRRWRGHERYR
jgi:hypothetical protein